MEKTIYIPARECDRCVIRALWHMRCGSMRVACCTHFIRDFSGYIIFYSTVHCLDCWGGCMYKPILTSDYIFDWNTMIVCEEWCVFWICLVLLCVLCLLLIIKCFELWKSTIKMTLLIIIRMKQVAVTLFSLSLVSSSYNINLNNTGFKL